MLTHNFTRWLDFWSVCDDLGIFAVQDTPNCWLGYDTSVGLRVEFIPRTGRFDFRIRPGGVDAIPVMSRCSLLMSAAFKPQEVLQA